MLLLSINNECLQNKRQENEKRKNVHEFWRCRIIKKLKAKNLIGTDKYYVNHVKILTRNVFDNSTLPI